MQEVEKYYNGKKVVYSVSATMEISSSCKEIVLSLPDDDDEVGGGWCLITLDCPQVSGLDEVL